MDAYKMSVTSAGHKITSKIYQDLKKAQAHSPVSPVEVNFERRRSLSIMDRVLKQESLDRGRKPHIGVVGAGVAGLRSADVLLKHGFRVTILEARNRIGGRMYQQTLANGHIVDMGPNWIHGTKGNPIMDLANETRTAIGNWDTTSYVFDEDGKLYSQEEGDRYSTMMWDIITEAFDYSNKSGADIDPSRTLLDFFEERAKVRILETEDDYERKRKVLLQIAELWGSFVGSPVHTQSLKFFWLEECIDGENLFCAGTYRKILERIARPVLNGASIRYHTQVSEIHGKSTTVNNTVVVKTVDGHHLEFDEIVLTTPLGWLKQNTHAFTPALPDRLADAIRSIGYGCLEKVYISFPTPFWLTPDPAAGGRTMKGFCQWLSPKYDSDSNPHRWTNEVVELASFAEDDSKATVHPTLLFYIYGDESRHVTSSVRALSAEKDKHAFLLDFFKPYYSRLPSYHADDPACQPTVALSTDWLGDELAGNGSYCNFQAGLEEGDEDLLAMRAGVPAEGIWMAGEHTAPFVAVGTVTGAYWSGEDVGRRIVKQYGRGGGKDDGKGKEGEGA